MFGGAALGLGRGFHGIEFLAHGRGGNELHEFVVKEGGAVKEPAFAENLAGDHVLEAVEGKLLADFIQGLEHVIDLLLVVGMGQEVVLLAVDGVVQDLPRGVGEGVGGDDNDVEVGTAHHAAGAFLGAGHAMGHLVGDVAGDHKSGILQDERFVGKPGEGHAEAFAGEVEFFAGDGGGQPFEFGGAGFEGGFLAGAAHKGVGEEFAADGGGEARIALHGGVEAHVAAAGAAEPQAGGMAGAPERQDVGEAAGRGQFGPGEGTGPGQDVGNVGHDARKYGACGAEWGEHSARRGRVLRAAAAAGSMPGMKGSGAAGRKLEALGRAARRVLRRVIALARYAVTDPPLRAVTIEISAACNRRCGYCPNHDHPRAEAYLDADLFRKMIGELKAMGYRGRIAFNLYNEPLMDARLPEFVAHVRKELPGAYILIDTNGDFLTRASWTALRAAGLDHANITRHGGQISEAIREILAAEGPDGAGHLSVQTAVAVINNRAGLVRTAPVPAEIAKRICPRPFSQLCVTYEGKGVLCCNDYFGVVTLGDARRETIPELWGSRTLRRYRRALLLGKRSRLKLCGPCDADRDLFDSPLWVPARAVRR